MMKKIISFALTIFMLVSMTASFTATVSAAEPLNIIYKNADADQIDLTFDATIDLTELANYVTLTKDGEPVEIKCDSPDHNFYGSAGNTKTDAAKNVRITPEAGYINQLELDTVYTLTVKAGFSSKDDTKAVTSDIIWSFVVKEIFRDDFESGSLAKWSVGNTANAQIVNTSSLNTGKALSLSSTANGTAAFVSPNSEYFPNDTADYTIKFDYVKNVPCYVSVFSDVVEGQTNSFRLSSNASSQLRSAIWYTAEGAAQASPIEANTVHSFTENGNKISLKNGTVRAYALRSGKMFFRTYEYNGSSLNGGVFSLRVDSATAPQYLDNVLVTKCVDVPLDDTTKKLNVIYKNADADQIDLTFDAAIDLNELAKHVTLTKNGVSVPITCSALDHTTYTSVGSTMTAVDNNVRIHPTSGAMDQMELGAVYTLTIDWDFESADGEKMLMDDMVWNFAVEEVFRDDFESGSLAKWSVGNTANAQIVNTSSLNTGKALSLSSTANGTAAFVSPNSEYFPNDTADYTIKFDYVKNVPCYFSAFSDDVSGQTNAIRLTSNTSSQLYAAIWKKAETDANAGTLEGNLLLSGSNNKNKLSLRNGTVRAYVCNNGGTLYHRRYERRDTHLTDGIFSLRVDSKDKPQYLDNVLVTKCVDIDDIYATDMELTLDAENFADATKASASMYIANGAAAEKDIVVIYALYKGDNEFVKAYNCQTLKLGAKSGASFALPETATENATKIKVFVWNDLTNLTPYDICQQFPAN